MVQNRQTFMRMVSDELLRFELGGAVVAALALENLELSTEAMSWAVRRSILESRASRS